MNETWALKSGAVYLAGANVEIMGGVIHHPEQLVHVLETSKKSHDAARFWLPETARALRRLLSVEDPDDLRANAWRVVKLVPKKLAPKEEP